MVKRKDWEAADDLDEILDGIEGLGDCNKYEMEKLREVCEKLNSIYDLIDEVYRELEDIDEDEVEE
ncbi:hypothetical protein [Saccharolobus islandicus]|uniref:hypothetical protein n=1 Tax=Saccharolobus islandicus TaxID=43080 RepID=UPI000369CE7A|nr:hypothetical protein [Sulfolobus islandicus]